MTAFDSGLRHDDRPVTPDRRFGERLEHAQVAAAALAPDIQLPERTATMTDTASAATTTAGATTTTAATPPTRGPYLCVHDAAAAMDWYRLVFGATELVRYVGDDGRIGHGELDLRRRQADARRRVPRLRSAERPSTIRWHAGEDEPRGARCRPHLRPRRPSRGPRSSGSPSDQFHGNRNALVRDPFGHRWMLNQPIDADRAEAAADADPGDFGDVRDYAVTGRQPVEPGYITMRTGDLERARAFFGALFAWEVEPGVAGGRRPHRQHPLPHGLLPGRGPGRGRARSPSTSGSTTSSPTRPGSRSWAGRCWPATSTPPAATPSASTTRASASTSSSPPPATDRRPPTAHLPEPETRVARLAAGAPRRGRRFAREGTGGIRQRAVQPPSTARVWPVT